jgi:hypothetical protein
MSSPSEVVVLRDGVSVALPAVLLALQLEVRGCRLEVEGDTLLIQPKTLLTDDDRTQIRAWKEDIKRLIAYCDDGRGVV